MPATRLSINYSPVTDIQNTAALLSITTADISQKDDSSITPLQLAKYFLYNRGLGISTDFGRNLTNYLRYPGGFITTGNKVNSKFSDLTIEQNLTVSLSSNFNLGFDMFNKNGNNNNRIQNMRRIDTAVTFAGGSRDGELLTVGDFKKYGYYKGMIMMWSGTYSRLVNSLPFWRLCAPPDSGFDEANGINIPNLQNLFIMGGSYTPYQPVDNYNPIRNFSSPVVIGNTGGESTSTLSLQQLPTHNHNYFISFAGGGSSLVSINLEPGAGGGLVESGGAQPNSYLTGGKTLTNTTGGPTSSAGTAGCGNPCAANPGHSCFLITTSVSQAAFTPVSLSLTDIPVVVTRTSEGLESRGGSLSHDNIPPYYALAYIIYVGTAR